MAALDRLAEATKNLATVANASGKPEILGPAVEIQNLIYEVIEQNRELKQKITDLQDAAARRAEVRFAHNSYWLGEPSQQGDGPYCSRCFDIDQKLVRLLDKKSWGHECPQCKIGAFMPWAPPFEQIRFERG